MASPPQIWLRVETTLPRAAQAYLMILWAAYWWRARNCADMFASAARQLVCRYLSCQKTARVKLTASLDCLHG